MGIAIIVLVFVCFLYFWNVERNSVYPGNSGTTSKRRPKNFSVPHSSKYEKRNIVSGKKSTAGAARGPAKSSAKRRSPIPDSSKYTIK